MTDTSPTPEPRAAAGFVRARFPGRWAGAPLRPGCPRLGVEAASLSAGTAPALMAQPVQQAQAQAARPGDARPVGAQEEWIEGPGYPSEDLDDLDERADLDEEACLFEELSRYRVDEALAFLDAAARERPLAEVRWLAALDEQNR